MTRSIRGYIIAMTGIVFWSTTGTLISYLIIHYHLAALTLAYWRGLFVCVALAPTLFLFRRSLLRIRRADLGFFLLNGLILAVFNSIWSVSVQANGAAVATVLGYSSAGFTAILALWIFKEKLGPWKMLAIVLSLSGCVLVSNALDASMWQLNPLGVITGLLSGLLFAFYSLMGKEAARRGINSWTAMLVSFFISTQFIMLFNLLPFLPGAAGSLKAIWPHLALDGWGVLILLSFGPTVLGFGLYNLAMNYLPAGTTNLLATSEPAMTTLQAYIFLGERMTLIQLIGSLVILAAVFIVQLDEEKPLPEPGQT